MTTSSHSKSSSNLFRSGWAWLVLKRRQTGCGFYRKPDSLPMGGAISGASASRSWVWTCKTTLTII
ncbi:hypothetical protein KCP76_10660 [Salmonella enterica subsp. enterica serovar Weltevreden]|nr:hypothetical protein KCP76_10660 [Salmonella enterica subsp. enterica serovar Weltevreden]